MTTQDAVSRDAKGEFKDALHSVHDGFNDIRDGFASAAGKAVEAGATTVEATTHQVEEGIRNVKSVAADLLDGTSKKIGKRPMTSVMVAVGVGFLSGYLLGRK